MDTLILIHPVDPRSLKVGGIETHVREHMAGSPPDVDVILIGIDEIGDLKLGALNEVSYAGRRVKIFPILRRLGTEHHVAAPSILKSLTFGFFAAFFRNFFAIRRLVKPGRTTVEIQRLEFSTFGRLLGAPSVQIVHGEGSPGQPTDSILPKWWFLQQINEAIATRAASHIIGVNPAVVERLEKLFPFVRGKAEMMTVSVNTQTFAVSEALPPASPLRVVFAGRLDAFKRPDILFRAIQHLNETLSTPTQFVYIGGGAPEKWDHYEAIKPHFDSLGMQNSAGVANGLSGAHVGLLASEFEGMPCFVLELLSRGRPLVSLDLPQLKLVVEDGVSGYIVPRGESDEANALALAHALKRAGEDVMSGAMRPAAIHAKIIPFSNAVQLQRLYANHARLRKGERRLSQTAAPVPA